MARESDQQDTSLSELRAAVGCLRKSLVGVDARSLSAEQAAEVIGVLTETERMAAAAKMAAVRVVERSKLWRSQGHRTAAHWMAAATGVPVGQAVGMVETARRLEHLPATTQAFASGELSEAQVREVAAAAVADPGSEAQLVTEARSCSVTSLKERCRQVRAAAVDAEEAYRGLHRSRSSRHWTDVEGAFRLQVSLTPDDGATLLAAMEPYRARIFSQARAEGRRESSEAYAADALVALAQDRLGQGAGPKATVHVRVDHGALVRGHAVNGEVCEIPGIGPIPVSVARRMASDSILKAFVSDGIDVRAVTHVGRTVSAKVRTALEARDPVCVVPGCDVRQGLEIDHRIPFAEGGPTTLDNLSRLCHWHHYLKSHDGYRLGGSPGNWSWTGPDPPGG